MTSWALLPAIAAYLVVAWLVWKFGLSIVGESPAGRAASPVVGALWFPAMCFLVAIALYAMVNAAFESAANWMRPPEERW